MKKIIKQTYWWIEKESILKFSYKYSGNLEKGERETELEIGWIWVIIFSLLFII